MALRRPKQERGLLGMGIRILGLGTQIPIPKRPSGDREETIIGATRAAYLRRGFGDSWTQPTRLSGQYVALIEPAQLLFLPCPETASRLDFTKPAR